MRREPFDVESAPWWYRLMMDVAVLILSLACWLLTLYFAFARWRQCRRDVARGFHPERYL
jgi:hypothetical protein